MLRAPSKACGLAAVAMLEVSMSFEHVFRSYLKNLKGWIFSLSERSVAWKERRAA